MRALVPLLLACFLSSCVALHSEPWSLVGTGGNTLGLSSGLGDYNGSFRLAGLDEDEGGVLTDEEVEDDSSWDTEYVVGGEILHWTTDNFALGGGFSFRRYNPEPVVFFGGDQGTEGGAAGREMEVNADDLETLHYSISARYYFSPWGDSRRWRPFLGADLYYVDGVDLELDVEYTSDNPPIDGESQDPITGETIDVEGDGYFGLSVLGGLAVLLTDDTFLQFGVAIDDPFGASNDEVEFSAFPIGDGEGSRGDFDVELDGLQYFVSLNYAF